MEIRGKEKYVDIMEKAFSAYGTERLETFVQSVREKGITEHGFPRLAADLSILLAHGRCGEYRVLAEEMLEICFADVPSGKGKGNDFSVKELVFALLESEKAAVFPAAQTQRWRRALGAFEPGKCYDCIAAAPDARVGNWAAFNAASEQLRVYAGICPPGENAAFLETQIASQLFVFDENGMYRDPNNPMLYDIVPRVQLALVLRYGYAGALAAEMREKLLRGAELTLAMQSVNGEMAFGGRSNQFLHNDAMLAALFEFYAGEAAKAGETERASRFKCAAARAADSVAYWLAAAPGKHVKNRFSVESCFGCEGYAYFDKYMITLASFAYVAYCMADDGIPVGKTAAPAWNISRTSPAFHKVFLRAGEYGLEFDTQADLHYDASGLGRVHRKDAPPQICLSLPCPADNKIVGFPRPNGRALSLCGGLNRNGEALWGADLPTGYEVTETSQTESGVSCRLSGDGWTETYIADGRGVCVTVDKMPAKQGRVFYQLPAFVTDGAETSRVVLSPSGRGLTVSFHGWRCVYETENARITDSGEDYCNRNGVYRRYVADGDDTLTLCIRIEKEEGQEMRHVDIYTDGACRGNPGRGGWGAVLVYGGVEKELSGGERETTNNRMELTAVISALSALKEPCDVTLTSDSTYVINAVEKGWALSWRAKGWKKADKSPALNADLWETLLCLLEKHSVRFVWVRGHNGHPYNERCDALATAFADSFLSQER